MQRHGVSGMLSECRVDDACEKRAPGHPDTRSFYFSRVAVIPNRPDRVYSSCLLVGAQARLLAVGVLLTAQSVVANLLFRGLGIKEILAMTAVVQISIGSG